MSATQDPTAQGAILKYVSNTCPQGTKFHILEVGWLEYQAFVNKRRELPLYCILIEHPHEGLILWETGCGKDYPEVWGPAMSDVFARIRYEPRHELRAAIKETGNRIEDVKKIIIGHLHADHAGGLDQFLDRKEVQIWVHDKELRSALWSVATGADDGVYLENYLKLNLNWKTFYDQTFDFCQGITLHHLPGHTDGLVAMQINMIDTGTFFFTSDHCHVIENWRDGIPQGWLARDHPAWFQSTQRLKHLVHVTKGRVVPGHDKGILLELQQQAKVFT
ncbi:beta-lactamase-like protein [Leptodontidium sp. MPI-SDFR-AT-0119]|nr:beta-lactamase-like protein [Leptodontidium sp. MPI-SDFR-AT-0119]